MRISIKKITDRGVSGTGWPGMNHQIIVFFYVQSTAEGKRRTCSSLTITEPNLSAK